MIKYCLTISAALLSLSACAGHPSEAPPSGDYELRSATPGIVDHNVIPKR